MDGYEELLLLAVKVDRYRSAAVDIEVAIDLLAVGTHPFAPLQERLLDLLASDRLLVQVEGVCHGLRLLHGEGLDLHLRFLTRSVHVGTKGKKTAEVLLGCEHQIGHLAVDQLRCKMRVVVECFTGDAVLILQAVPVDHVQLFLDVFRKCCLHDCVY